MLENLVLHAIAKLAVRTGSPLRAKRWVGAIGSLLPPLSIGEAMAVAQELGTSGTCLTQALTIAARLPRSVVVIGSEGPTESSFSAHAWVECDGTVVSAMPPARAEITRF
jgi:hypothetical protein